MGRQSYDSTIGSATDTVVSMESGDDCGNRGDGPVVIIYLPGFSPGSDPSYHSICAGCTGLLQRL